jgi:hypothetical protein
MCGSFIGGEMKLNIKSFALACGILWSISMLICTFWVIYLGDGTNAFLEAFSDFYFGYTISIGGAFVGLLYGFFDGLIGGFIFAWLYNKLAK